MRYTLSLILCFAFFSGFAQDHMTPEMLLSLKRVASEGLDPNGKVLYYSTAQTDIKTEKRALKYFAVNLSNGENAQWQMPEGKNITQRDKHIWYAVGGGKLYASKNEGKSWEMMSDDLPDDADNIQVSPDGKYVAYSKDVLIKPMQGSDIYPDLPKTTAKVYTDLDYRHWDTWEDGYFSHVFILKISDGKAIDLMEGEPYDCPQKPFGEKEDFVWEPDSRGIVYVCKKKFGKEYALSTNTDLYYYDVHRKSTTNLTVGMMGYDTQPVFSPDGKRMAWTSMAHDGYEADKNDIYVMDMGKPGVGKLNLTENWDGTVESFVWNKNGNKIIFNAAWKGTEQLFEVNAGESTNAKLKPEVKKITKGDFDINSLIGLPDKGHIVVSRCDMNHASELFMVNLATGEMNALTHENDAVYSSIKLSKTVLRTIVTPDGSKMGVWIIYPPDFNPKKKYPTLLYCQGGPQSALSQFYSFRWNFQLMAAQGYIIVAPNRHGMPGWGVKWNEEISKDWGGKPMEDYLAAIDDMSNEPYVDKDRLGCVGASYGGYSVYMLAGMHNNRFKTFIAHDGVFDLRSWFGTTEELWFPYWDIGGAYWQKNKPEGYQRFNPINYVSQWNTPIMIIQGGIDYRVPIEQGLEAFQAAQLRGIKSKLLYIPNENHWVLHAQNALLWQREFFKWLDETLK
jgi:dipeptidyl aminopeptidase/acylaminoacyl peptidase